MRRVEGQQQLFKDFFRPSFLVRSTVFCVAAKLQSKGGYKKVVEVKVPNYNWILEQAGDKDLDFALTDRLVVLGCHAGRRYLVFSGFEKAAGKGVLCPPVLPVVEQWVFLIDDAESHEALKKMGEMFVVQLPLVLENLLHAA